MTVSSYMSEAIREAREGIRAGHGGPFGSVIVKDGRIVGRGHNRVLINHDPTCHGEIAAIRDAGQNLGTHDLSGCELYTTGEPCPMCLCACLWANIERVRYGCSIEENAGIGFRDERFEKLLGDHDARTDYLIQQDHEACREVFDEYASHRHTLY